MNILKKSVHTFKFIFFSKITTINTKLPIFLEDDNNPFQRLLNEFIFFEMNLETALSIPAANKRQSITGVMSALNSVIGRINAWGKINLLL